MPIAKRYLYQLKQFITEALYWALVLAIFVIIKFGGTHGAVHPLKLVYALPGFWQLLLYAVVGGILLGSILSVIRMYVLSDWLKNKSFGMIIFYETVMSFLVFIALIMLMVFMNYTSLGYNNMRFSEFVGNYFQLSNVSILISFFLLSSAQFSLFLQADKKLGLGVLKNLISGKYYLPKEEDRVFMFLDMKDSTANAETLGHLRYSRLLQDCYRLLTDLVIEFNAEIYQFVGDEVVITWESTRGFENNNSLRFFFAFREILEANRLYFLSNYGLKPEFKAALHCGKVSVAEVGEFNTQIAYHGDVVNTTSRIQELCSTYGAQLLASDTYMSQLEQKEVSYKEQAVEIALRGKQIPINIYNLDTPKRVSIS